MSWRSGAAAAGILGLTAAAAMVGTGAGADSATAAADAQSPAREQLTQQVLGCPTVVPGKDVDAQVVAASVSGLPGQDTPGRLSLGAIDGKGKTVDTDVPGATVELSDPESELTAVATATGGTAPGAAAGVLSHDTRGEGMGLVSGPCAAAVAESWLVGGGAAEGQRDSVHLVNPTNTDSIVDLTVYSPGGIVEATGDEGIVVPAGETRMVRLDALAPGLADLAVHVRTQVGLISATVVDDRMDGLTPRGVDIVVDSGRPARTLVTAPLPAGAGDRRLLLLAPDDPGTVRLTALTPDGEVPLLADQDLQVRRGKVLAIDLTKALAGRTAAVRVVSETPVLAAASAATDPDADAAAEREAAVAAAETAIDEAEGDAELAEAQAALAKAETANAIAPGEDLAWFAAARPLRGWAAVAGLRSDLDTELLVTADDGDAKVEVGLLPARANGATVAPYRTIAVSAGTTVSVRVTPPKGADGYTAVLTVADGPAQVRASHVQRGAEGAITGYAASSLPVWTELPPTAPVYAD